MKMEEIDCPVLKLKEKIKKILEDLDIIKEIREEKKFIEIDKINR